ncbi:MAG: VWA domain-containing protein [Dehalococcoidales bacterium]|nr:VWA domain-containing protein [Dehalococcoidales bacterium]
MVTNALVTGSIGQIAQRDGISIAESFLTADVIVLVDVSGSMAAHDSRGGKQRYEVACQELTKLQNTLPGKLAVVAFSSETQFVPGGQPPFLSGSTDLAGALRFVQPADGCVRFIVVSDGYPDEPEEALAIARRFQSVIDVVYVGPESDLIGLRFLEDLARAAGGRFVKAEKAAELADKVSTLMIGAGR